MTATPGRWRVRVLWTLLTLAVAVLLLKTFVADVYPVTSGSMRPTIFGGVAPGETEPFTEYVLVRFVRGTWPRRWDLVVIRPRGGGDPLIKRVVGLPGESVQISGGDVLIEEKRLDPLEGRPELIPLFDDRHQRIEDFFLFTGMPIPTGSRAPDAPVENQGEDVPVPSSPWTQVGAEWHLDATDIQDSDNGMMLFNKELDDAYLDQNGAVIDGHRQVNDGAIECEALLEDTGGRLRLQILEEGDKFQAVLHPAEGEEGGYVATFLRRNVATQNEEDREKKVEVLHEEAIPFGPGAWHHLRFSNIDNHLVLEIDGGAHRITVPYERNEAHGNSATAKKHIGNRVGFGGESTRARFRAIRVLRDLFYTNRGKYAVQPDLPAPDAQPRVILGPGEYFVLGDNSAESSDSRNFGVVAAADILGRPVAVVWPFARRRGL